MSHDYRGTTTGHEEGRSCSLSQMYVCLRALLSGLRTTGKVHLSSSTNVDQASTYSCLFTVCSVSLGSLATRFVALCGSQHTNMSYCAADGIVRLPRAERRSQLPMFISCIKVTRCPSPMTRTASWQKHVNHGLGLFLSD